MLKKNLFNSVADLLPQTGEMILLDKIEDWDVDFLEASVFHNRPHWYNDANGDTPAWVGIEYMAQSIAALAGIKSLLNKEPVRIGFLLGTRKYIAHTPTFKKNTPIAIHVESLFLGEDNLALFDCKISSEKILLAQAQVKAIQPNKIEDVIKLRPTK